MGAVGLVPSPEEIFEAKICFWQDFLKILFYRFCRNLIDDRKFIVSLNEQLLKTIQVEVTQQANDFKAQLQRARWKFIKLINETQQELKEFVDQLELCWSREIRNFSPN